MTVHNEANKEDIAKTVIMPGDPLRVEMIANKYLKDAKKVNSLRGISAYTGYYKDKRITVMASGMGIPSIGIYSYELYKFYDVENIIRIGTCGANREDIKLLDVILADSAFSLSTFAYLFDGDTSNTMNASNELNNIIKEFAKIENVPLKEGKIITSDVFNVYVDKDEYMGKFPKDLNTLASEMEAFGLFFIAKKLNKKASCLLTVVDSQYDEREISSADRQNSLNTMIELALEATTGL